MNKSNFIRLSGWSLIAGAVVFAPYIFTAMLASISYELPGTLMGFMETISVFGFFWGPVLLAVGMLGLQVRYENEFGVSGKSVLLLGAIAGLLVIVGNIGQANGTNSFWSFFIVGTTLIFICLIIFGVIALIQRPLPRMNWLPLIAGIWFPLMSLPGIFDIHFPKLGPTANLVFSLFSIIGITITTIALIMLGYTLLADASQKMETV